MSERSFRVLVVGATGLVGREILSVLEERDFPVAELHLCADEQARGSEVEFAGRSHVVDSVADDLPDVDLAFLCGPAEVNRRVGAAVAAKGALAIDLEGDASDDVVLGPGDPGATSAKRPIHVAHPAARLIVAPLRAIGEAAPIRRVVATLVVPASAFGAEAVEQLGRQTISLLNAQSGSEPTEDEDEDADAGVPDEQEDDSSLAFRCAPLGEQAHVARVREQASRLLAADVAVQAVRAPAFYGQAASISVETASPVAIEDAGRHLREAPSVVFVEGSAGDRTTFDTVGIDAIQVVGLRQEPASPQWIHFWAMAENVRQGGALPAVALAESLLLRH